MPWRHTFRTEQTAVLWLTASVLRRFYLWVPKLRGLGTAELEQLNLKIVKREEGGAENWKKQESQQLSSPVQTKIYPLCVNRGSDQ